MSKLTDAELRAKTDEFKRRLADKPRNPRPVARGLRRGPARPPGGVLDQRPFDVQVMGAAALHLERVAE